MGAEPLHVFHIAKEALYDVAHGVKVVVVGDLFAGIALKWNDCQCPLIGNLLSDFAATKSLVGNDGNSAPSRLSRAQTSTVLYDFWSGETFLIPPCIALGECYIPSCKR